MKMQTPQIEIAQDWEYGKPPFITRNLRYRSIRFRVFIFTFLVCISISLIYVFSQPAIYLSYATLLTTAKTEIDQRSKETDFQHVLIQKQILLGQELISETSERLKSAEDINNRLTVADIRTMLNVNAIEETNLIKMTAEGSNAKTLPLLINTWIDVYLNAREKTVMQLVDSTIYALQLELADLAKKIDSKRIELNQFREKNNIASTGREENEALVRLKGLNESYNKASEEVVIAKTRMEAVKKAIDHGQTVVPKEDTRTLSLLELQAQKLREKLAELDHRYTREYMGKISKLRIIPEQLALLEDKIARMREKGQLTVLTETQQQYAAATQAVSIIRKQLNAHKNQASLFTANFIEYETLQRDLEAMELLLRDTQERLIKIESKQFEKYPQVDVIERAFLPDSPIRPNYFSDALIAISGSILLALFSVWLLDFLGRKDEPNSAFNISGIHLYDNGTQQEFLETISAKQLSEHTNVALESHRTKEISNQAFAMLLLAASDKGKQLIILLLSGLSLEEITLLHEDSFNNDNNTLHIRGVSPRSIPINPVLELFFPNSNYCIPSVSGELLTIENLESILLCSIIDAGLAGDKEINIESIRTSYIIYLVRQGIRLSDLQSIIGYVTPDEISSYGKYSPQSIGRSLKEIDLIHPALIDLLKG